MKEHTLELLGRKHTVEEIREKFMLARTLGFDNINMDLIAGLPEETLEDFKETLREVEALKPGKECLYNIFIMEELQSILALGSGGSSKIVFPEENRMERVENVKSVDDYIGRIDEMIRRKKESWR